MKLPERDTHDSGDDRASSGTAGNKRRLRTWRAGACTVLVVAFGLASCGTGEHVREWNGDDASVGMAGYGIVESTRAKVRIGELRARFLEHVARPMAGAPHDGLRGAPRAAGAKTPALGAAVATGFERSEGGGLRAVLPSAATRGVTRTASVEHPMQADGECYVEDATSRVSVRFRLHDARASGARVAGGYVLYEGALDGADVVHRVHAEGTEDYVVFETRPAREELRYDVDVSRVPGLRLVSNTLEFLDEGGSPALRVAPPYVIDARGTRHDAKLAVRECMYDASVAAPWGRAITRPGADRCTLHVTWSGVAYPAIVDPAWTATGSMATARSLHTASLLASGKVLVAGGHGAAGVSIAGAELFEPGTNGVGTFAATGPMTTAREHHTASVLLSGKVLVTGGFLVDGGPVGALASAELFDPNANGSVGAFAVTGSMTTVRTLHTASLLASGKVLVAGGYNKDVAGYSLASAELFDPAAGGGVGAFAATGPMATTRNSHTASVLASGNVLIAGGTYYDLAASNPVVSVARAELFYPATGVFAATGSMTAARHSHAASLLPSGKVLIAGGNDNTGPFAIAELFDPAAGSTGAFTVTGSMSTGRNASHTTSVLVSGKVLVAGGSGSGFSSIASAELFDPNVNGGVGGFASSGVMTARRSGHTATVLPSATVLIAGGYEDGLIPLASAELFGGGPGDACTDNGSCRSGFCADVRCCDTACAGGGCDRCDLPGKEGTCTITPSGSPGANPACAFPLACDGVSGGCPTSCASDAACAPAYYCAPDGTCLARKPQGAACNTLTNCKASGCRECTTCQACVPALKESGLADGVCGPTKNGIDPQDDCASGDVLCGPDGMCNGAGACRELAPAGSPCGPVESCTGGFHTSARVCNGSGVCPAPLTTTCTPFICGATTCNTSCTQDTDCAAGRCDLNASKCVAGDTCDADHTIKKVDGKTEDCSPYRCDSNGTCRKQCNSVGDCVAPTLCDTNHECVAPAGDGGNGGGCALSARGAGGSVRFAWPYAALGLLAACRRRRGFRATKRERR